MLYLKQYHLFMVEGISAFHFFQSQEVDKFVDKLFIGESFIHDTFIL